jgi:small-conductance mechanosensitive channel
VDIAGERRRGDRSGVSCHLDDGQQFHRELLPCGLAAVSPGNVVEIIPENLKGRVIDRNLLFTVLREQNGGVLVIPNNLFVQKMFRVVDGHERTAFELLESLGNPSPNSTPIRQEIMGAAGHG